MTDIWTNRHALVLYCTWRSQKLLGDVHVLPQILQAIDGPLRQVASANGRAHCRRTQVLQEQIASIKLPTRFRRLPPELLASQTTHYFTFSSDEDVVARREIVQCALADTVQQSRLGASSRRWKPTIGYWQKEHMATHWITMLARPTGDYGKCMSGSMDGIDNRS